MSLPYPNMDFTALDVLHAADLDKMVANIEYINNNLLSPVVLFSGNGTGDITLSSDITSFDYVEIYAHESGGRKIFTKVAEPALSNRINLHCTFMVGTTLYTRSKDYEIASSTSLTQTANTGGQATITSSSTGINSNMTQVIIDKVVGYKYLG